MAVTLVTLAVLAVARGVYKLTNGNDGFINRLELSYRVQGWFDSIKSK